jgi:hypothetical protein
MLTLADNEVVAGVQRALEYAQKGVDALEAAQVGKGNVQNPWDEVPPRPKELQDLIRNIFAHDDIINEKQNRPDRPENRNDPYKQTLKRLKLKHVYGM